MANRPRDHFSSTLIDGRSKKQTTPAARRVKVELRERVLQAIGADNAHVFDAYCGEGEMHAAVWHRAASYVGCDEDWYRDGRTCFVADNRRVMRAADLMPFNLLDADSFGSPWEPVTLFAARRPVAPGEKIGMVLTEGSGLRLKMGWIPDALALLSGLRRHMPGVARNHEDIIDRAIAETCRRMACQPLHQWRAKGRSASSLWYIGLVLQGNASATPAV